MSDFTTISSGRPIETVLPAYEMPGRKPNLLELALQYHDMGLSVLPVRGKKPAISKWIHLQKKRAARETVEGWFNKETLKPPPTGVAVIAGAVSGDLVVRDFDTKDSYIRWKKEYPELAATIPTVKTARGYHVLFRFPGLNKITNLPNGEGELRGGGYSLLPPSLHPSGQIYEWVIPPISRTFPLLNPFESGLSVTDETDETDETEDTEETDDIEAIQGVGKDASAVELAILRSLPGTEGQRNLKIFALARSLKGLEEFKNAELSELKPIVREWHQRALPVIGTKPFDDTWADFVYGWGKVKYPKGAGGNALDEAIRRTSESIPSGVALRYDSEKTQLLVGVCRELQRANRTEPFFLSVRAVGKLLDVDAMTAGRRLNLLVSDKVLAVVKKGSSLTQRATRYKYIGDDLCEGPDTYQEEVLT